MEKRWIGGVNPEGIAEIGAGISFCLHWKEEQVKGLIRKLRIAGLHVLNSNLNCLRYHSLVQYLQP
jgi:hypothetical protein